MIENNMRLQKADRLMSTIAFHIMATIMTLRGLFRHKRREVELAGVQPGHVVLDFGCGLGFSTLPAAEIVGDAGKVYAVDIHPLAIKTVERKVARKGLTNVELICAEAPAAIPDESVDTILLFNVLPMVHDRSALIKELYRVLKPQARLAVKNGHGSKLAGYGNLKPGQLDHMMTANGPLVLKTRPGKHCIFEKV